MTSSGPPPHLPTETIAAVLSFLIPGPQVLYTKDPTLEACSWVSWTFRTLTLPYLFRSFSKEFSTGLTTSPFRSSLGGRYTISKQEPSIESLARFVKSHTRIAGYVQSLRLYYKDEQGSQALGSADAFALLDLLNALPSLSALRLEGVVPTLLSATALPQTSYKKLSLSTVSVDLGYKSVISQYSALLCLFDFVEELHLEADYTVFGSGYHGTIPRARTVYIQENIPDGTPDFYQMVESSPFLSYLRELRVTRVHERSMGNLYDLLGGAGRYLELLHLSLDGISLDDLFRVGLTSCRTVRNITLELGLRYSKWLFTYMHDTLWESLGSVLASLNPPGMPPDVDPFAVDTLALCIDLRDAAYLDLDPMTTAASVGRAEHVLLELAQWGLRRVEIRVLNAGTRAEEVRGLIAGMFSRLCAQGVLEFVFSS